MSHSASVKAALQWYLDQGIDEILADHPVDRTKVPDMPKPALKTIQKQPQNATVEPPQAVLGAVEAIAGAQDAAQKCSTLEELKAAILAFEGLSIKNTAANMVFSNGNPDASIMIVGEAPGADDDRHGKPFLGPAGQLLDKILACIDLDKNHEKVNQQVYLTNVLNWRPPGNRTPSQAELDISKPFIQKHIELMSPKILILLGGLAGQTILDKVESISKLRGSFHNYNGINTIVTYPPAYLLTTPAQKRAVWHDILMVQEKKKELGF